MPNFSSDTFCFKNSTETFVNKIINMNPGVLRYVDHRLEEWANWYSQDDLPRLGHSPVTIEYKLMTTGQAPKATPGPKPVPVNPAAEEIEAIIRIMAVQDKEGARYAEALRERYLRRKRNTLRESAKKMAVTKRAFEHYVKAAYLWLASWFTAQYAARLMQMNSKKIIYRHKHRL